MGWNGSGAGAGAASGAAAGMTFGPWGAVIGGALGGIAGGMGGGAQQAPPPQQVPGPATPGSISAQQGGMWIDPYTGQINQAAWQFDPTQMQSQWDAQSMYDSFMGNSNGSQNYLNSLDWKIKQAQQELERLKSGSAKTVTDPATKKKMLGDNALLVGDDGQIDNAAVQKYGQKFAGNPFFEAFLSQTGGNYGGGYEGWFKEHVNGNLKKAAEEYKKNVAVGEGNSSTSGKAIQDLQNQIDYMTQYKGQITGQPSGASNNPLLKYTNDIGPTWKPGDNTNPYRQSWEEVMQQKLAAQNGEPNSIYKEYGLAGADGSDPQALFRSKMESQLGGLGNYDRVNAPKLDNGASGNMLSALNFRTQQNFTNQKASRDAQLARRGMASSAVNELAGANDSLLLGQGLNENALNAANYFNQNVANQFGMEAQAAGQNNAADLARRQLGLQYTNEMGNTAFNQALAKAGFANTVKNNLFGQAMGALGANNTMRQQERDWNWQDYMAGKGENETAYNRNMNMYNLLNNQRQQAFGNQQTVNNGALQGIGTFLPLSMSQAANQNSANAANAQQNNAWQMYNAQNAAGQQNANTQGMWGALGSLANSAGRYNWGTSYTNPTDPKNQYTGGYGMGPGGGSGYGVD